MKSITCFLLHKILVKREQTLRNDLHLCLCLHNHRHYHFTRILSVHLHIIVKDKEISRHRCRRTASKVVTRLKYVLPLIFTR